MAKLKSQLSIKEADLSIVIPVYNEEECIEKAILTVFRVFGDAKINFELIVVDDGSRDRTAMICRALQNKMRFSLIRLKRNSGYSKALLAGFLRARGSYVTYMDADLQYPSDQILKLYLTAVNQAADFVVGCCDNKRYRGVTYHYLRRLISKVYNLIVRALFNMNIADVHAKKVFKRELIDPRKLHALYGLIDLELLLVGLSRTSSVKVMPMKVNPRFAGKSKLTPGLMLRTLLNLFKLKKIIRNGAYSN